MKTTIELADDLLIAAKKRAAELRRPMRQLVESGLRRELSARPQRPARPRPGIRWVTVPGGLPPGLDLGDRAAMAEWLSRGR
jgi:hypothetical protein